MNVVSFWYGQSRFVGLPKFTRAVEFTKHAVMNSNELCFSFQFSISFYCYIAVLLTLFYCQYENIRWVEAKLLALAKMCT